MEKRASKHLETYQSLLDAAFEEGTVEGRVVNRGGKVGEVQVEFTVSAESLRRNPVLERLIDLSDQI
jgi:hypothetical protein